MNNKEQTIMWTPQLMPYLFLFLVTLVVYKARHPIISFFRSTARTEPWSSKSNETKVSSSKEDFDRAFSNVATKFSTLYEELFLVSHGNPKNYNVDQLASLVGNWQDKIELIDSNIIKICWANLCAKHFSSRHFNKEYLNTPEQAISFLRDWIQRLVLAGLTRGPSDYDIAKDKTFHYYYSLDSLYRIGDRFKVSKSYWSLHGHCIEMGVATLARAS